MKQLALGLAFSFILPVVAFSSYALGSSLAPEPKPPVVVHHEGLKRFPVLDSKTEIRTGIFIVCKAYSNRPGFDVTAPVTDSALGFRVLSDCRTVRHG